jgi:hypothetical protein
MIYRETKTIKTSIAHIEIEKQKNEKLLFFYFLSLGSEGKGRTIKEQTKISTHTRNNNIS